MRTRQGEAVVVLLNLCNGNLPATYRMALFAVGAELPAMNVGMAVMATLAHIGEHRLDVALRAGYGLMHAA